MGKNHIIPNEDDDLPVEIPKSVWKFGQKVSDVSDKEWKNDPKKGYNDAPNKFLEDDNETD